MESRTREPPAFGRDDRDYGEGVATEKVDMTVADIEGALKRNVLASVGIAALVGYLWGGTR